MPRGWRPVSDRQPGSARCGMPVRNPVSGPIETVPRCARGPVKPRVLRQNGDVQWPGMWRACPTRMDVSLAQSGRAHERGASLALPPKQTFLDPMTPLGLPCAHLLSRPPSCSSTHLRLRFHPEYGNKPGVARSSRIRYRDWLFTSRL